MKEKVLGILGGLGPAATVDLFQKIIEATPARIDQEHLRILIDNNPKIPCRVKALKKAGPSPVPGATSLPLSPIMKPNVSPNRLTSLARVPLYPP